MQSPKYSLKNKGLKLLKSLGLSLLGGFSAWLLTITQVIDLGVYAPLIGSMMPFLANAINEFIKESK